jgi:glycerophosphoryl diester phosphodiesterase/GNAT superfamily N-acetyltransferase
MLSATFNLQGHRGARGLKPGNTLPSFEAALDVGVTSIETDLHLTRDGHVIVSHGPNLSSRVGRMGSHEGSMDLASRPLLSTLTRAQLADFVADVNPDPVQFPEQDATATPVATLFAQRYLSNAFALPTLDEFIAFVALYAGQLGEDANKSADRRARAAKLVFDLELKRVPGRPERMGDGFDGRALGLLEEGVLDCLQRHGVVERTVIRSFDHRCIRALKEREPRLQTAVLIANTAPVAPEEVCRHAGASIFCLDVNFLDEIQVRRLHAAGIAVLPWTVNDPKDWDRLLSWGVDGITTDYPNRLAAVLRERSIAANPQDVPTIARLIRGLADYEQLGHAVVLDETRLANYLFGVRKYAEVLLAEDEDRVVGFALFFHNFSTFLGRPGIYLEDLFIEPGCRGKGHGKALLSALARLTVERGCGRLEWAVLDWNEPAIQFYKKLGAEPMNDWTVFRLAEDALQRIASNSP